MLFPSVMRKVMGKKFPIRGRFRLARMFSRYMAISPNTVIQFDDNLSIELHCKQTVSKQIYYFGIFEPIEVAAFKNIIKPGMCVIDAGANIGQYTLMAAKRVGSEGKVFTFEPSTDNYQILCRNVHRNGFNDRVILKNMALSSHHGFVELFLPEDGSCCSIAMKREKDNIYRKELVESTTIDRIVEKHTLNRVDVIKVDAEGADFEIIQGAKNTLERMSPQVFIECSKRSLNNFKATPHMILEYLAKFEYKPYKFAKSCLEPLGGDDDISNTNLYFSKK